MSRFALQLRFNRCRDARIMSPNCPDRLAAVIQRPEGRIERKVLLNGPLIKVQPRRLSRGLHFARHSISQRKVQSVPRLGTRAGSRFSQNSNSFFVPTGDRERQSEVILEVEIAGADVETGSVISLCGSVIADEVKGDTHRIVDTRAFANLQRCLKMSDGCLRLLKGNKRFGHADMCTRRSPTAHSFSKNFHSIIELSNTEQRFTETLGDSAVKGIQLVGIAVHLDRTGHIAGGRRGIRHPDQRIDLGFFGIAFDVIGRSGLEKPREWSASATGEGRHNCDGDSGMSEHKSYRDHKRSVI